MTGLPDHYRYVSGYDEGGVFIDLERFIAFRETDCFYWLIPEEHKKFVGRDDRYAAYVLKKHQRRVSKTSDRRFAYPDKRQALGSFLKRKQWQVLHSKIALGVAEAALTRMQALRDLGETPEGRTRAGKPEFMGQIVFE